MSGKLKPSRRELISGGLIVLLVAALAWTAIDGTDANAPTIGGIIAHQDATLASITAALAVMLIGVWLFLDSD